MTDRTRIIIVAAAIAALLLCAAAFSHADAATLHSLQTWVVSVTPAPDYCVVVLAAGMNGTVLKESGAVCWAKQGALITVNYTVGEKRVWTWNRFAKRMMWQMVPTYTYSNYFMGWANDPTR